MKFLAILRDSVREAMDAKVIYFLFGLSALLILVAFSISYKAEPGDEGLKKILERLPGAQGGFGPQKPLKYAIEDFKQVNPGKPAWEGQYRYDLVVTEPEQLGPPPPEEDAEDADEKDNKDKVKKKAKPPARQPSLFRITVLFSLLEANEAELNEEEIKARERVRDFMGQVLRAGGRPNRKQMASLNEQLGREIEAVTPARMVRFLEKHLTSSGTMDVTGVTFLSEKDREFRFRVENEARSDTVRTWPHEMWIFFAVKIPATVGVGTIVYLIEDYVVCGVGASVAMLLGVVVTAFFIPNMLRKGSTDLLISKPIPRWWLLLCKYVGGLSFVFINTVVIVVGIWLALGLRSGLWGTGFLLSVFVLTGQFAIFYAVSTLLAVLTRSPIVCILGTCFVYAMLWGVSALASMLQPFHEMDVTPAWMYNSAKTTRQVLPRYKDFDQLNSQLIARDLLPRDEAMRKQIDKRAGEIDWGASLTITGAYVVVMLGLACWLFSVKDF